MLPQIPTIETARLTLCGHRPENLEESLSLWSDPRVTQHIGGKPLGREEVWARLLRYLGHWAVAGYGLWQVRERSTGRFVGEVGFADFKRDIAVPFDGAPEGGWMLAPWSHGQGYATEALDAGLAWLTTEGYPRTVCIIDLANVASLRVAAKCGYRELARAPYKGQEVVVFERRGPAHTAESAAR